MASKDDNFNLKWRAQIEFRTKTSYPASTHLQRVAGDIMHGLPFKIYGRAMGCTISVWKYRHHRSTSVWKTSVRHHLRKVAVIESKVVENKCITIYQLE